jgi:hypothetical protein
VSLRLLPDCDIIKIKCEEVICMGSKTLTLPEDALVNMLKTLPENVLIDVFWRTVVESDTSVLSDEERAEIEKSKEEHAKGETLKWEDMK